MSSASVFYPQLLTDTKHIRSSNMTPDRNYRPNLIAISTVRRNIFGPVDHEECRNFVEMHLNQHQIESMDYWGFDFVNEIPRPSKRSRFMWETVPDKTTTRPQKKQCCEPEHDITHLYPEPLDDIRLEQEENTVPPKSNSPVTDKTKQSLITDFLKVTKNARLQQLKKKINLTPSPNRTGRIARSRKSLKS